MCHVSKICTNDVKATEWGSLDLLLRVNSHHRFDCSHLGYIQHCTPPEETGYSHLADRTEDIHSPAQPAYCNNFGIRAVHIPPRIAESSVRVGRTVLRAEKNWHPVGSCLLAEDCCSSSFAAPAARGSLPAQQGRLPKNLDLT